MELVHDHEPELLVGLEFDDAVGPERDQVVGIGEGGGTVELIVEDADVDAARRFRSALDALFDVDREGDVAREVCEADLPFLVAAELRPRRWTSIGAAASCARAAAAPLTTRVAAIPMLANDLLMCISPPSAGRRPRGRRGWYEWSLPGEPRGASCDSSGSIRGRHCCRGIPPSW